MQLSENIRFLKVVKWYLFTMTVGTTLAISVYIWGYIKNSNGVHSLMRYTVLNFIITFNGILLPIVTIITVPVWKQEFVRLLKSTVNRSAHRAEESA
uniref:Uncharacterized protein n=1 Tax=Acrobeloides nanus TaxID=290746 RepID=A0A914CVQ5_9BILA